jgi:hypothetical protein
MDSLLHGYVPVRTLAISEPMTLRGVGLTDTYTAPATSLISSLST